jgi:hypothetical protein
MSFRNNFRIIFLIEKIGFSKELSKKVGARDKHRRVMGLSRVSIRSVSAGARQRCDGVGTGENGSRHWTGVKRGDKMKKQKVDQLRRIGPKDLTEYRKGFLISRI